MSNIVETEATYFGHKCKLVCDGKCHKAWGLNSRPRHMNGRMIADDLLGDAPVNPETYEGGEGKPLTPEHNKWCWRECERSEIIEE